MSECDVMSVTEVCVHCAAPAGRPVVPGRWHCAGCGRWQWQYEVERLIAERDKLLVERVMACGAIVDIAHQRDTWEERCHAHEERAEALEAALAHVREERDAAMNEIIDGLPRKRAAEAERTRADAIEECAALVEDYAGYDVDDWPPSVLRQAAEAIRALANQDTTKQEKATGC